MLEFNSKVLVVVNYCYIVTLATPPDRIFQMNKSANVFSHYATFTVNIVLLTYLLTFSEHELKDAGPIQVYSTNL